MPRGKQQSLIEFSNFNLGGLANSLYSGIEHSSYRLVGIDLHSIPGIIQAHQALEKISTGTGEHAVDSFIKVRVPCSDGNSYWFSSTSGKIWKCTTAGVVTLVHTTTPDKGNAGCLGAAEYYGYIIWATQKRLHRIPVSGLTDWSTNAQEDWQQLNLDQELVATGQTYTLTTGVNEGATHKQQFVPIKSPCEAIALNINAKGTGNWTVKIHDSSNNEVGTATVTNANLSTGWFIFILASAFYPVLGATYHIHVYSSVADGSVVTNTTSDFETAAFRTYTDSDDEQHPMKIVNLILFIGDQNMVHQVEVEEDGSLTFTKDALDILEPFRIKCFGRYMIDLLIGTVVKDNVNETEIFRWNTWSPSFTSSDPIPENGINAFFEADNFVFINAGIQGNIYVYNGETLEFYRKVPGEYSPTKYGSIHPNAVDNLGGLMLFGFSNGSGNPALQGVYTLGRYTRDYPFVTDLSYPISERSEGEFVLTGIEIGAILVMGMNVFVSWKNGSSYGIDKLNYSVKLNGAYLETMAKSFEREIMQTFARIVACYAEMPAGTSITLAHKINYAANFSNFTSVVDEQRKVVFSEESQEGTVIQAKLTFNTTSNNSPKIESFAIFPK